MNVAAIKSADKLDPAVERLLRLIFDEVDLAAVPGSTEKRQRLLLRTPRFASSVRTVSGSVVAILWQWDTR